MLLSFSIYARQAAAAAIFAMCALKAVLAIRRYCTEYYHTKAYADVAWHSMVRRFHFFFFAADFFFLFRLPLLLLISLFTPWRTRAMPQRCGDAAYGH